MQGPRLAIMLSGFLESVAEMDVQNLRKIVHVIYFEGSKQTASVHNVEWAGYRENQEIRVHQVLWDFDCGYHNQEHVYAQSGCTTPRRFML